MGGTGGALPETCNMVPSRLLRCLIQINCQIQNPWGWHLVLTGRCHRKVLDGAGTESIIESLCWCSGLLSMWTNNSSTLKPSQMTELFALREKPQCVNSAKYSGRFPRTPSTVSSETCSGAVRHIWTQLNRLGLWFQIWTFVKTFCSVSDFQL